MKSLNLLPAAKWLAGCAVLMASAAPVLAATWSFVTPGVCSDPVSTAALGNTYTCNGGPPPATVTGWGTNGTTAGSSFAKAYVSPYGASGFGVANAAESAGLSSPSQVTAPNHAMDNSGQIDALLLDFGANSLVALNSISLGNYKYASGGDTDISILRYTGTSAPVINGKTLGGTTTSLIAGGWQLVGSYADLSVTTGNALNFNNTAGNIVTSSWWLISAYNSNYGSVGKDNGNASAASTSTTNLITGLTAGNDYVKVLSVAGTYTVKPPSVPGVPEPGSLALVGAALAGVVVTQRRKARAG